MAQGSVIVSAAKQSRTAQGFWIASAFALWASADTSSPEPVIGLAGGETRWAPRNDGVMAFRSRDTICPSHAVQIGPLHREGAGKAGSSPLPWPACERKMHAAVTTGSAKTSRPSLRDGFTAYTRSPQGPAVLPLSSATPVKSITSLASAPGGQDHATSPSTSVALVARNRSWPSQPASTFVTTRTPLSMRWDARSKTQFLQKRK